MAAGHPSTQRLVEAMVSRADDPLDSAAPFAEVADAFIRSTGRGALGDLLQQLLAASRPPAPLHASISKLAVAGLVRNVITTNYDDLLERSLAQAGVRLLLQVLDRNLETRDGEGAVRLIKLHGSRESWLETVLSGRSYDEFQSRYRTLFNQMELTLRQEPVLFLGCSLNDPRILDWLADLDSEAATRLKPWRSIMTAEAWAQLASVHHRSGRSAQQLLRRGNVRPLLIKSHDEIAALLDRALELARPPSVQNAALASATNMPELPLQHVGRPELESLTHAITTQPSKRFSIEGMAGVGKTTAAAAVASDPAVEAVHPDGVFWFAVGRTPDLLGLQLKLLAALGEPPAVVLSESEGKERLAHALAGKRCLIVLDDVWRAEHASAFVIAGAAATLLVTTRDASIGRTLGAQPCLLPELATAEARQLFAGYVGMGVEALPREADAIVDQCAGLPLAIAMTGSMLRGRAGDRWPLMLQRLQSAALDRVRADVGSSSQPNLLQAVGLGLEHLDPDLRERYLDLAVFPESIAISESVLETYWALDRFDVADLVERLRDCSLVRLDARGSILLHDLQRDYIRTLHRPSLLALHEKLLEQYRSQCDGEWETGPRDGYFFEYLVHHLLEAGRRDEVLNLLGRYAWLEAKLNAVGLRALLADFERTSVDGELATLRRALVLSAHVIGADPTQLASQLMGRLFDARGSAIQQLLAAAQLYPGAWLRPLGRALVSPDGALLRTMQPGRGVSCIAVAQDGHRIIAGSNHGAIQVWDSETGECTRTLETNDSLHDCACDATGRLVLTGSYERRHSTGWHKCDERVKLWDLDSGTCLHSFEAEGKAIAMSDDGTRAISSDRYTAVFWDLGRGKKLTEWAQSSEAIAMSPDASVITWFDRGHYSREKQSWVHASDLCVWRVLNNTVSRFRLAREPVALALTRDARLIAWVDDQSLVVVNADSGTRVARIRVGRLLDSEYPTAELAVDSSSDFAALAVTSGVFLVDLRRRRLRLLHRGPSSKVVFTPDGSRLVSAAAEGLRIWDPRNIEQHAKVRSSYPRSHAQIVAKARTYAQVVGWPRCRSSSPDETLVAVLVGSNIEIRRLDDGALVRTLVGHGAHITTCAFLAGGAQLVSAATDGTVKIWSLTSGYALRTLRCSTSIQWLGVVEGERVVWTDRDGALFQRDRPGERDVVRILESPSESARSVVSQKKSRIIVGGRADLEVWNVDDGALAQLIAVRSDATSVDAIAISDDRSVLATCAGQQGACAILRLPDYRLQEIAAAHAWMINEAHSVALSADGVRVIVGAMDGKISVFRVVNAPRKLSGDDPLSELEQELTGHTRAVTSLVMLSPERFASASMDGTIHVWDLVTGRALQKLYGHTRGVRALAWSPRRSQLVSGSEDCTIGIWDFEGRGDRRTIVGHDGAVTAVALAPDGSRIVSGSVDCTLRAWTLDGHALAALPTRTAPVEGLAVLDSARLVVSYGDGEVELRALDGLALIRRMSRADGHTLTPARDPCEGGLADPRLPGRNPERDWFRSAAVTALAIAPDGRHVIVGAEDGTTVLWNLETDQLPDTAEHERFPARHRSNRFIGPRPSAVRALAFGRDSMTAFIGAADGCVARWCLQRSEIERVFVLGDAAVTSIAVLRDGVRFAAGTANGVLSLWELERPTPLWRIQAQNGSVAAIAELSEGLLVSGSDDGSVRTWNEATGRQAGGRFLLEHPVTSLAPCGVAMQVIVASDDALVLLDLARCKEVGRLSGHRGAIQSVSAQGSTAISAAKDRRVKLWDLALGRCVQTFAGYGHGLALLSHDGHGVVSARHNQTLRVRMLQSRSIRRYGSDRAFALKLPPHRSRWVGRTVASSRGPYVASSLSNKTARVWNLDTGRCTRIIAAHNAQIQGMAITSDGSTLVTGDESGTIKTWNATSGQLLREWRAHAYDVDRLELLSDDRRLVSASRDGTICMWEITLGELLATFTADDPIRDLVLGKDDRLHVQDWFGRLFVLEPSLPSVED